MLLNRRVLRTVLNSTETTDKTKDVNDDNLSFVLTTSDFFYLGFHAKFASRYFHMSTANTNTANLTVEYWDGTTWQAVTDFIDQTAGLKVSGFISWIADSDWQKMELSPVTSPEGEELKLYWVRVSTDADFSAGTELSSVLNLFSDDSLVRALYPEFITDTRWLPVGRTDFLEQHIEAKNRVVRRLIQKRQVKDESQIIDINEVAEAAVHAFIDIVLSPIATSEDLNTILQRARASFETELTRVNLGLDLNQDGKVSEGERSWNGGFIFRR